MRRVTSKNAQICCAALRRGNDAEARFGEAHGGVGQSTTINVSPAKRQLENFKPFKMRFHLMGI